MAIQRVRPRFAATNIIVSEDRSDRVVLTANRGHNSERRACLEKVVFRNDLAPEEALEAVCEREGEVDIVSEVLPTDARRVNESEHAKLVTIDANRLVVGIFNTYESHDAPLDDVRVREALNWAVDRHRLVDEGLLGYGTPLVAMTPSWCNGLFPGAQARRADPTKAQELFASGAWPQGRPLRIATPGNLEAVADFVAACVRETLAIDADVIVVPADQLIGGARMLIEKKLVPPWDVLMHAWFDLSSDLPPAVVHREFFGEDGAFRAGPVDPKFDELFAELVRQTNPERSIELAEQIDRYVFDQSGALFLCSPQALYAVNRYVDFKAYKCTLELADTEVSEEHWSRR
jgi:ABC-type transport system substrate-binding protein